MTDWYVDQGAGGTGTGLTPANAVTNLNSLTQTTSVQFGDTIWVRKNHFELHVDAANRYGANGTFNAYSHAYVNVVGWPNSGDPFYAQRTAAGISASWDSDVGLVGFDAPTLISSRATLPSFTLKEGTYFTNFVFSNSVTFIAQIGYAIDAWKPSGRRAAIGKVYFRNGVINVSQSTFSDVDEIVICTSNGAVANPIIGGVKTARKITVVASTLAASLLQMPITYIGEVHILSNSVGILARQNTVTAPEIAHIGKVYGVQPTAYSANNPAMTLEGQSTNTNYPPLYIGDYYGLGHRRFGSRGKLNFFACTSAIAAHSATPALCLFPSSQSAGTGEGQHATDDNFTGVAHQVVQATNGVPLVAYWHFYTRDCGSLDMRMIGGISLTGLSGARVQCTVANSGIRVGTVALWSGNSISAGSAWLMRAEFLPSETNTAFLTAYPPGWALANSGVCFVSPFFEVRSS